MAIRVTWLGHNAWSIDSDGTSILIDPFLDNSPTSPVKSADVAADYILVSHGHSDHVGDTIEIAQRTGATVISNFEISVWLEQQKVKNVVGANHGGTLKQPFGDVKLTIAFHSSVLPDGTYGGNPVGFLLTLSQKRLYFACDTALFSDMQLLASPKLDLAVVPIGDIYTMGPDDSIQALKFLAPRRAVPCHYNTWPPIAQDAQAWAERVKKETSAEPLVLVPGDRFTV